jgi:archaellum biogenesis ATPase FlaH
MRPPFDENILQQINNSDTIQDDERINLFIELNEQYQFSVIPVRGGFAKDPNDKNEVRGLKAPLWKNYTKHGIIRTKNLMPKYFRAERAGICCGPASNLLVLDIDNPDAFKKWCEKQNIKTDFSDTLVISTGRVGKGYHVYFEYPTPPINYKYGIKKFGEIFSIQGLGSIVIAPGSLHPGTKVVYQVINNKPIQLPPKWVLNYSLKINDEKKDMENAKNIETKSVNEAFEYMSLKFEHKLTENQIAMLNKDMPVGKRSEAIFNGIRNLLETGIDEKSIVDILMSVPLGKRAYEKPNPREYLFGEIERAKETIGEYPVSNISSNQDAKKKDKSNYQGVVSMTLDEIQSETVSFEFLIKDLWPKGESFLLTGEGGCGKSLFALNMALDLVSEGNTKFIETYDVVGDNRVLFLQSENSRSMAKARTTAILRGFPVYSQFTKKIRFFGINNDIRVSGDLLKDKKLKELLHSQIEIHKANILIIDPLVSFHSGDENSNDQMRRVMDSITAISDLYNLSTIVIHHEVKEYIKPRKAGGRGASAIGDWAAYSFNLMPPKANMKHHRLTPNKSRDLELSPPINLHLGKDLRFIPLNNSRVPAILTTQNVVVSVIKSQGKVDSFEKLFEEYKKYCNTQNIKADSKNKFRPIVKDMVNKNQIKQSTTKPFEYSL